MSIRFCKNSKCNIVINEYNADCSCVFCDKAVNQCNIYECADKRAMKLSAERHEMQSKKCHGCMRFSRYLISQRSR
ncbi:MAG: hypothetical protein IJN91_03780 [Alphaproteobacteria bacterium]|nr:hypothetical protein [Alphaproteobacteria bacterium]